MAKLMGRILKIAPTRTGTSKSGKEYKIKEFLFAQQRLNKATGQWEFDIEHPLKLAAFGDKCEILENIHPDRLVEIDYDLVGKRYADQHGQTQIRTEVFVTYIVQPKAQNAWDGINI